MNNPFSLDFGAKPNLFIARNPELQKIRHVFEAETPSSHMFMIIGARGTGKTVLMTAVSKDIREMKNWIHIDLNPDTDMLQSLAANLYKKAKKDFPKIKLGVSVKGVSVNIESEEKYSDIQLDIDTIFESLKKHNIRVLITIDEVVNSKNMREFSSYFQHCLREEYPVFVIMTGLYKNIRALQNNRSHTFLRRTPKIVLTPLNMERIAKKYEEIFGLESKKAMEMAAFTGGYSYGFQILGFLVFESETKQLDDVLFEYKMNLIENSYEKIWEELSVNERKVLRAIAECDDNATVKEVRGKTDFDTNNFSTYQNTLEKSGILALDSSYGRIRFVLPLFREYVLSENL